MPELPDITIYIEALEAHLREIADEVAAENPVEGTPEAAFALNKVPPIFSSESRRMAMTEPMANCMPSSMSAIITPDGISTDMPRASRRDQKLGAGTP